jgi:hypothetical protein
MQQRPSRLRNICQQRGKDMADDMLFIEHSHQMEKGVSAFFIIRIRASCSFLQVSPSFFSQKTINIADCRSVLSMACEYFYIFVVRIWHIKLRIMYNLNELAFEAMLENLKHTSNGNPFAKFAVDSFSYEYNRQQYNDCLRHINEENNQIANIYNQISQRGGFITPQEQMELQRHIQLRGEYEVKSMKHFMSGGKDAGEIVNNFVRR